MVVGLGANKFYYEIMPNGILTALFSTVGKLLEPSGWGSRFPYLQKELYMGYLPKRHAKKLLLEVAAIREELTHFPPDQVVWDIDDLQWKPPWADNTSPEIKDLSGFFIMSDGNDLFDLLIYVINDAISSKSDISIAFS